MSWRGSRQKSRPRRQAEFPPRTPAPAGRIGDLTRKGLGADQCVGAECVAGQYVDRVAPARDMSTRPIGGMLLRGSAPSWVRDDDAALRLIQPQLRDRPPSVRRSSVSGCSYAGIQTSETM